ncbi:hypothetical protein C7B69_01390 [filamentous cyanobacterium Phorm 46]|nr:hypothetical protein C7B69_01390 [filamentous cyanobacterium Phorm 46]PSB53001.1 hypothetical protein C7B67_04940 [filamentous cyanobacterium Phorm 6]
MCETGDIFYIAFLRKIRYANGIGHRACGHRAYLTTLDNRYIILFEILDFGVSASVEGFEIEELRMTKQNCNNNKKRTFAKSLLIA